MSFYKKNSIFGTFRDPWEIVEKKVEEVTMENSNCWSTVCWRGNNKLGGTLMTRTNHWGTVLLEGLRLEDAPWVAGWVAPVQIALQLFHKFSLGKQWQWIPGQGVYIYNLQFTEWCLAYLRHLLQTMTRVSSKCQVVGFTDKTSASWLDSMTKPGPGVASWGVTDFQFSDVSYLSCCNFRGVTTSNYPELKKCLLQNEYGSQMEFV